MTQTITALSRPKRLLLRAGWLAALAAALGLTVAAPKALRAETGEVRISQQFGLGYLPLIVVRNQKMIEKHTVAQGLPPAKVTWARLSGGAASNDALLSGSLDYAAAGIAPVLVLWDKTRGNLDVQAVGGLDASAAFLNTSNPNVKTIRDFTEKDRIAVPAVKASIQALWLQIAVEQLYGVGQHTKLDTLTVTLPHPEATVALLSGRSEITAHFATPPFNLQQLENANIRRITTSWDILGGPSTVNVLYTTSKFRKDNPKTFRAVHDAFVEAYALIERNPQEAARIFVEEEKGSYTAEYVESLLKNPAVKLSWVPLNTGKIADFLHRTGAIKNKPASWKDYFFPEIHPQAGS